MSPPKREVFLTALIQLLRLADTLEFFAVSLALTSLKPMPTNRFTRSRPSIFISDAILQQTT